ncbi:MAG: 4-(cytidine 5'-diphospho)-2-C-methyl-D-erythritol kinase [Bacteroidales bacterium]
MICFPNAKINIGLNIVSRREDGYHNLETIFYPVALADSLEVIPASEGESTTFENAGIEVDGASDSNLVMKAYRLIAADYELPALKIYLRKNIPFGAGLGGGSADAAFMIKLLNTKFDLQLTEEQMEQYATRIGADAPFFIRNKPVFATGIGNEFHPIDFSLRGYHLALIKPDVAVSTPEAYSQVKPCAPAIPITEIIKRPIEEWKELMHNDFEDSAFPKKPVIAEIKQALYDAGAIYASMSGSGSSVFGIFREEVDLSALQQQFDCFCFTAPFE